MQPFWPAAGVQHALLVCSPLDSRFSLQCYHSHKAETVCARLFKPLSLSCICRLHYSLPAFDLALSQSLTFPISVGPDQTDQLVRRPRLPLDHTFSSFNQHENFFKRAPSSQNHPQQFFNMAASDAAVPSTVAGRAADRRGSPQPASQSKRDRKRQALMERLASMNDKFQRERDMTYRDQLQKIQFDTNLVQRFDPYDPKVLEVISEMQKEHKQTQGPPVNAEDARSLLDMAGIRFSDFIDEVEDLVEIRDFQLAQSKVRR